MALWFTERVHDTVLCVNRNITPLNPPLQSQQKTQRRDAMVEWTGVYYFSNYMWFLKMSPRKGWWFKCVVAIWMCMNMFLWARKVFTWNIQEKIPGIFFPLLGGVQSKNHNRGESDVTPEIRIHSGEDKEDWWFPTSEKCVSLGIKCREKTYRVDIPSHNKTWVKIVTSW